MITLVHAPPTPEGGRLCPNCMTRRGGGTRGLCRKCRADRGVSHLYPAVTGVSGPWSDGALRQAPEATRHPPGTEEKIEVMMRRVVAGHSPFHPEDVTWDQVLIRALLAGMGGTGEVRLREDREDVEIVVVFDEGEEGEDRRDPRGGGREKSWGIMAWVPPGGRPRGPTTRPTNVKAKVSGYDLPRRGSGRPSSVGSG